MCHDDQKNLTEEIKQFKKKNTLLTKGGCVERKKKKFQKPILPIKFFAFQGKSKIHNYIIIIFKDNLF